MSLQKQLDPVYDDDRFWRDRRMIANDNSSTQVSLLDKITQTAQQLADRIANHLSVTLQIAEHMRFIIAA